MIYITFTYFATPLVSPCKSFARKTVQAFSGVLYNILDGHHRYKIQPDAPTIVIPNLSEDEKIAYVYRSNLARRNLSQEQRGNIRQRMKALATNLNLTHTQAQIAALLGVSQFTVSNWIKNASIIDTNNACIPETSKEPEKSKAPRDHRTQLGKKDKVDIYNQYQKGGCGKTATCHNLGAVLAESMRVLMIDTDPQASLTGACGITDAAGRFKPVNSVW